MRKYFNKFKRYYSSPTTNKRGCLCKDGQTYSRKCCDGSYQAQGVGRITNIPTIVTQTRGDYVVTETSERIIPE